MKKSLLALAVLGAFAGAASAQTNVTVYGIVDAGLVHESGDQGDSVTKLGSGVQSGSRLGFKGTEDLGGGLKANFQLENGFTTDDGFQSQGGRLFGRQAWVGLSGGFGNVAFGRQYNPYFLSLTSIDPFGTGLAGQINNLFDHNTVRTDNAVGYTTANFGGLVGSVMYGFGEVAGENAASRTISASVTYANGPIRATLAHHNANNATDTGTAKNTLLGGTFDFGVAKAHAAFAQNDADDAGVDTVDSRDMMVGASVPFGASTFLVSYLRKNDSLADNDANQIGVGYTYALSKRTNFYAAYARISNDGLADYEVGNASSGGTNDKAFNVGVRHQF
jgi:predicted porin